MGKSTKDMNLGVVVEAKIEYTRQLCNLMKPIIYNDFLEVYDEIIENSGKTNDYLMHFQKELQEIPKWNSDKIDEYTKKITSKCSYLNDLITAIFLSHVKILTSVKLKQIKQKVKLVIPTNEKFVHKCYSKVAETIYNDPFIFSNVKYQGNVKKNLYEMNKIIDVCIEDTIRELLPIENILQSYLGETLQTTNDSDDEIEEEHEIDNEENEESEEPEEAEEQQEEKSNDGNNNIMGDTDKGIDDENEDNERYEENENNLIENTNTKPDEQQNAVNNFFKKENEEISNEVKNINVGVQNKSDHVNTNIQSSSNNNTFFDDIP